MAERTKLTEKTLREAVPIVGRDYQIFDSELSGFAVCIYRGGGRAFTLDYRHAGRQRRMTFARWPDWSVSAARGRAREIRRDIDAGADPLAERGALREAPRVSDLIARYCAQHLPKLAERNAADQRAALAKLVAPVWGRKLVTEITSTDVDKLLNKIAEGRARPHKEKPNNRARKLQPAKPKPVRANRMELSAAQGPKEVTADLRKRFASLRRSRSYVDWRKQRALIKDLNSLLAQIETVIAPHDAGEAFELLWSFLQLAPSIHERTDDSNGSVTIPSLPV